MKLSSYRYSWTLVFGIMLTFFVVWGMAVSTVDAQNPKQGGTLILGASGDILSFDAYHYGWLNSRNQKIVYNHLVRYTHDNEVQPELAEKWDVADDGKSIVLHLRKGVKFHNGREMTSDDVAANFTRARSKAYGRHVYQMTLTIDDVEVLDKYTLKIFYETPTPAMFDTLSRLAIVAPEAFYDIKKTAVGTGPFRVKEWIPGDHIIYERNPDYWEKGLPYLDKIMFRPYTDTDAMVLALESGELDMIEGAPYKDVSLLQKNFSLNTGHPGFLFYTLYLSPNFEPWNKKEARQAVQYCLNRKAISDAVLFGTGEPTTSPFPPSSFAWQEKFELFYSFNIEKAKELIAAAGYEGGVKATVMACTAYPELAEMAQILKSDCAQAGIEFEIKNLDPAEWYPILQKAKYPATFSFASMGHLDPSQVVMGSVYRIQNNPLWGDKLPKAYQEAALKGQSIMDREERKQLYGKFQQALLDESWALVVARKSPIFAMTKSVKGFDTSVDCAMLLDRVWLDK